ncbi:MAG: TIGR04013 family B12-binding domain/radical SAM domain-containing protein [Promethearchaeota archaeon]
MEGDIIKDTPVILYHERVNKNSWNALLAAIETEHVLEGKSMDLLIIESQWELLQKINELLRTHALIHACFSLFTSQFFEIKWLVKNLKRKYGKKLQLIAGGPHPTGDPRGTLDIGFDIVVRGEGEKIFPELLKHIKNNEDIKKMKGISFINEQGKYQSTGKRPLIRLDDYRSFPKHQFKRFGPIEITRGCPHCCYFCQTPHIFGTKPRHRSIESIYEHVDDLVEQFKDHTDVRFVSPNAFSYGSNDGKKMDLDKIEELLRTTKEHLPKKGRIFFGTFPTEMRPEHVIPATLDLIKKYVFNDNIVIGAQSGSQRILDSCNRGHSIEDIRKAVELTIKYKLGATVDFIFGLPGENEKDVEETIKLMKDLTKLGAKIHAHSFMPLPQTVFSSKAPGLLNKNLLKVIEKLTSNGNLFGSWKKQAQLAKRFSNQWSSK